MEHCDLQFDWRHSHHFCGLFLDFDSNCAAFVKLFFSTSIIKKSTFGLVHALIRILIGLNDLLPEQTELV